MQPPDPSALSGAPPGRSPASSHCTLKFPPGQLGILRFKVPPVGKEEGVGLGLSL